MERIVKGSNGDDDILLYKSSCTMPMQKSFAFLEKEWGAGVGEITPHINKKPFAVAAANGWEWFRKLLEFQLDEFR